MNCKKCGFQLTENDQFCRNCGTPVESSSVQNNSEVLNSQVNQGYSQVNMQQQPNVAQQPMNSYSQNTMQQPNMANMYNTQNTQSMNQKPKNNIMFIVIGIAIVAVIAGIIGATGVFKGDDSNNTGNSSNVGNNNDNGSAENKNNSNNNTSGNNTSGSNTNTTPSNTSNNTSYYTVKYNGFTFKIPTNLVYATDDDSFLIGDEDSTWGAYIEVVEGSYSQLLSRKGQMQSLYQSMGYTASPAVEKTIGGMSFITMEVANGGTNMLLGMTKANSMNIFGVTLFNEDNSYDYKTLETVSNVLSNAKYVGTTNNMSSFKKPDSNGLSELAK